MKRNKSKIALKCCPDCGHGGEGALVRKRVTHRWQEGVHEKRQYSAALDVVACTKCGAEVIDEYARLQQHEVWCNENGLLGPRAIRDLRDRLKLSQEDFAKLLRLGPASVRRWERGVTVQNASLDSLMRLLQRSANVTDLARWAGVSVPEVTGGATTRLVAADGTKGAWKAKHSEFYTPSEDVRTRAASFTLSIRTA
jgi:putative zinc finger/helix-turn-helix YgiT family protein